MKRNVGRIKITGKFIRDILDFRDAVIWDAVIDKFNNISLLIEHPDLPEVDDGDFIQDFKPLYTSHYGDNGVIIKLERIYPLNKWQNKEKKAEDATPQTTSQ